MNVLGVYFLFRRSILRTFIEAGKADSNPSVYNSIPYLYLYQYCESHVITFITVVLCISSFDNMKNDYL